MPLRDDDGAPVAELRALGHELDLVESEHGFGVGQCILVEGEALVTRDPISGFGVITAVIVWGAPKIPA